MQDRFKCFSIKIFGYYNITVHSLVCNKLSVSKMHSATIKIVVQIEVMRKKWEVDTNSSKHSGHYIYRPIQHYTNFVLTTQCITIIPLFSQSTAIFPDKTIAIFSSQKTQSALCDGRTEILKTVQFSSLGWFVLDLCQKKWHSDWFFSENLGLPQSLLSRLCTTILFILKTTLNRGTNRRSVEIKKKLCFFGNQGTLKEQNTFIFVVSRIHTSFRYFFFFFLRFNSRLLTECKNVRQRKQRQDELDYIVMSFINCEVTQTPLGISN